MNLAKYTFHQTKPDAMSAPGADTQLPAIEVPSRDAVLQTAELLEAILLELPCHSVLLSAAGVNRTWHSIINNSISINKKIMTTIVEDGHCYDQPHSFQRFFWGAILIRRVSNVELIYAFDLDASWSEPDDHRFSAQFLTGGFKISGLSVLDQERLDRGWTAMLQRPEDDHGKHFYREVQMKLYEYLDPVFGPEAKRIREMILEKGKS